MMKKREQIGTNKWREKKDSVRGPRQALLCCREDEFVGSVHKE